MPYIKSYSIGGLAGRDGVTARTLNEDVNILFGPNGSGKTSLLRIFHSALLRDTSLLKEVPFTSAEIVVHSYTEGDIEYRIEMQSSKAAKPPRLEATLRGAGNTNKPEWLVTGGAGNVWPHEYLPIARLYEAGPASSEFNIFATRDDSEMGLESRFALNLLNTWKDYTRGVARETNQIQEEGLARILARVISKTEPSTLREQIDSSPSYEAVSMFLARRGMQDITPTSDEFRRRYSREPQFRNLVQDIEEVEKRIAQATAPTEALRQIVSEMFIGGKELNLKDDAIEVAILGKELGLSQLSSGEKQLLKILVATVNAGASVIIVDEPELSLHVDWQRRLVTSMRVLNPLAQLIIATHSPEIMAEIPDSSVFQI